MVFYFYITHNVYENPTENRINVTAIDYSTSECIQFYCTDCTAIPRGSDKDFKGLSFHILFSWINVVNIS